MKTKTSPVYAGVDIGKAALDVALPGQSACRYANSAVGIAELVKALKKMPQPAQVICEPSGGYEGDLLEALWAAQIAVSLVPAARVRAFARAQGRLAKTDPIDAVVLREFGELFEPTTLAAPSPHRQRLAALVQRREQLVSILAMEEPRRAGGPNPRRRREENRSPPDQGTAKASRPDGNTDRGADRHGRNTQTSE